MRTSSLPGALVAALLFQTLACGGRSVLGTDEEIGTPVDSLGGSGGVSSAMGGAAGQSGKASTAGTTAAGGTPATGGASQAGTSQGGVSQGGSSQGGSSTAGTSAGGSSQGGKPQGGTGGVSTAGTSSGGGSGGPQSKCGSCLASQANNDMLCPQQRKKCENTKGCGEYGECLLESGCLGQGPQCAEKAGCKASQQARQALRQLLECTACAACDSECPQLTQDCAPVDLEQQCEQCQAQAFPLCEDTYNACLADPACGALLNCFDQCPENQQSCYDQCFTQYPDAQQGYVELVQCFVCKACGDSCGKLQPGFCN